MLRIRLFRIGKKNQPFFRIVVTDRRNPPKGGRFKEVVGFYNPLTKERKLKKERIKHWLSVGAQASDTVHNLLIKEKILKGNKIPKHKKKREEPEKKEVEKKPAPAPASAPTEAPAGKEEKPEEKTPKEEAKEPEKEAKKEEPKK